jgi:anti-sigma factor RsiW
MKNFRDIELLSSYLDGQLSPSESARLEARLSSDTELASAFNDLRAARGILRKLPARKAPRNFTLTRQMVGLKPPLPRSYSFFRFSTAFATVLFALTFAANALSQIPLIGANGGGFGMGGGGGGVAESAAAPAEAPAATEEPYGIGGGPAATEAPAAMAPLVAVTATPAGTFAPAAPALEMQPAPTMSADAVATEAPTAKQMETPPEALNQPPVENQAEAVPVPAEQPRSQNQILIPVGWQIALFILVVLSGLIAFLLRRSAIQKWK